jgi:hypothetical protein
MASREQARDNAAGLMDTGGRRMNASEPVGTIRALLALPAPGQRVDPALVEAGRHARQMSC